MDIKIIEGLVAAAQVAADHCGEEADYFMNEGEEDTASSFASREQEIRNLIHAAKSAIAAEPVASAAGDTGDELLIQIQSLLDNDASGSVRDAFWDLIENTEESPF